MLALAGMSGLLAWLGTPPPRDQLLHLTGQLQELTLRNANAGAFTITLLSSGALQTFDFDNAHRLVGLSSSTQKLGNGRAEITVTVGYFEIGRDKKVVDVVFGKDKVLSYDTAAGLAAEKAIKDRNSSIGFGVMGALLISLGGLARLGRGKSQPSAAASSGALLWLVFYGLMLVVMLTEPALLHRTFGTTAFYLPIEYVLPVVLALLLLPLWPGCMGLTSLLREAMRKGRGGKLGMILEMRSALASDNPVERQMAMKTLWFFAYFGLLAGIWIAYAAMLGI